jgi:hypothetical protein
MVVVVIIISKLSRKRMKRISVGNDFTGVVAAAIIAIFTIV